MTMVYDLMNIWINWLRADYAAGAILEVCMDVFTRFDFDLSL